MHLPGNIILSDELCSTAQPAFEWRRVDLGDASIIEQTRRTVARICAQDTRVALEHDIDWLLEEATEVNAIVSLWLCYVGNEVVGYAPLTIRPSKLNFSFGETTLASLRIKKHKLVGCPLFTSAVSDYEGRLTESLVEAIRRTLPRRGVLFLLGARADSAFFGLIGKPDTEACFWVQSFGPIYNRRLIQLPESYEAYLSALSKATRTGIRRNRKKLNAGATGRIKLSRFVTPEDVEPFLDAAIPVSRKTYQWKSLGIGLHDRQRLTHLLRTAAERGAMLCYVLYDGTTPLSFQVGYKFRGIYYAHETGYDPDFTKFSVGNQLHCLIVRDLIEHNPDVDCMDLLYGDTRNKERFSNAARQEGNFYLFPRTIWGTAAFLSLKFSSAASGMMGNLLLRYGLKDRVRELLRC